MIRFLLNFLTLLLLIAANHTVAATHSVDLNALVEVDLTKNSYIITNNETTQLKRDIIHSKAWAKLERDQFKLGRSVEHLWLKKSFSTTGFTAKKVRLELHRLINRSEVWLYENGAFAQQYSIDRQAPQDHLRTNNNILDITLYPNREYTLFLNISSADSFIGGVKLWDIEAQTEKDTYVLYFSLVYFIFIIAISLYNLTAYFSTQQQAFIFHAFYIMALLIVQLSEFNFLNYAVPSIGYQLQSQIVLIAICLAYISLVLFINDLIDHKRKGGIFYYLNSLSIIGAFLTLLLTPFISYIAAIMMISYLVVSYAMLGLVYIGYSCINKKPGTYLAILLFFIFAPAITSTVFSRLGVVEVNFYTEYALYFSIVLETVVVSILFFARLRGIKSELKRAIYLDNSSNLPNQNALRLALLKVGKRDNSIALVSIWLSGLEKAEGTYGVDFRQKYADMLVKSVNKELSKVDWVLASQGKNKLYLSDTNKLSVIGKIYDQERLAFLFNLVKDCIDTINYQKRYRLDIDPIIVACHTSAYKPAETLINTYHALSHCLRNNINIILYHENIGIEERRQLTLTNQFIDSLNKDEFFLHWQPQFNGRTKKLEGIEALVRWEHPTFGSISPGEFIPMLEKSLQIKDLTRWVIGRAFDQFVEAHKVLPQVEISINLSAHDLLDIDFLPFIKGQLSGREAIANYITLEITESVLLEDNIMIIKTVESLQMLGFKISIDDFGAGYASFGYLQNLPIDEIKIDKRYIDTCHEENSQAIIESIIYLAKKLNLKTVAEGIEEEHQVTVLNHWGTQRLQGWRLAKPMLMDDVIANYA